MTTELRTTAERAADGAPVGDRVDTLAVVAQLRCARTGRQIGVVLHLDRSGRGMAPVLLAEVCHIDTGRTLSAESAAGTPSTGDRLDRLDAVPLDEVDGEITVDCPDPGSVHVTDAAALRSAARDGYAKGRAAARDGRPARPVRVQLDHRRPTWTEAQRAEFGRRARA